MKPHHLIAIALALLAVPSTARAAVRTWDGGGADLNWSTAANWVGDVAPVTDDDLVFPAAAVKKGILVNDVARTYRSITIESLGYTLSGQPVTLTNGITSAQTATISLPLVIPNAQTFKVNDFSESLFLRGAITIADTLTLEGPGNVDVFGVISGPGSLIANTGDRFLVLHADNTFTGGVTINSGRVAAQGRPATGQGVVTLNGGRLFGQGQTGDVHCNGGDFSGGNSVTNRILDTRNVIFNPGCTFSAGFATATTQLAIRVAGSVDLGGANFRFSSFGLVDPAEELPVVIIDNDGNDPVAGTFAGLPEGALGPSGDFRITYKGGDGNDVALTALEADLNITNVASNGSPVPGQDVTFTLTASNAGPSSATNAKVVGALFGGLTFVSATPSQGTCSNSLPISCTLGTIASGGSAQVSVVARVVATGSASASVSSDIFDGVTGDNSASASINAAAGADLGVTNTVNDSTPAVGQDITFNLTVSNAGPSPATVVNLTDTLPSGLTLVRAGASQGTCTGTGPVVCALGTLASGGTAQVSIVARVTQTGQLTNSARVVAAESDPVPGNDTASVTIDAAAVANAHDVPALDERALVLLAVLLVVAGFVALRRLT